MPAFLPGPYTAGASERDGYTAISAKKADYLCFAEVVTRGEEPSGARDRLDKQAQATLRLFLNAPEMFDLLVRFIIDQGKRGGLYDHLLPANQQERDISWAMKIVADIEGETP